MSITNLNLYMVSDSSGETVVAVSKAVVSQFDNIKNSGIYVAFSKV